MHTASTYFIINKHLPRNVVLFAWSLQLTYVQNFRMSVVIAIYDNCHLKIHPQTVGHVPKRSQMCNARRHLELADYRKSLNSSWTNSLEPSPLKIVPILTVKCTINYRSNFLWGTDHQSWPYFTQNSANWLWSGE